VTEQLAVLGGFTVIPDDVEVLSAVGAELGEGRACSVTDDKGEAESCAFAGAVCINIYKPDLYSVFLFCRSPRLVASDLARFLGAPSALLLWSGCRQITAEHMCCSVTF
jgi:hypothetical protein